MAGIEGLYDFTANCSGPLAFEVVARRKRLPFAFSCVLRIFLIGDAKRKTFKIGSFCADCVVVPIFQSRSAEKPIHVSMLNSSRFVVQQNISFRRLAMRRGLRMHRIQLRTSRSLTCPSFCPGTRRRDASNPSLPCHCIPYPVCPLRHRPRAASRCLKKMSLWPWGQNSLLQSVCGAVEMPPNFHNTIFDGHRCFD